MIVCPVPDHSQPLDWIVVTADREQRFIRTCLRELNLHYRMK